MTAKIVAVILFFLLLIEAPRSLDAHEVRPGYLEIRQRSAAIYDVLWKVPARGDLRLRLEVRFPDRCSIIDPPVKMRSGGAFLNRWSVRCPEGLEGHSISIDGLVDTMTDVLVRLERADGTTQVARLTPAAPSFTVEASPDALQVSRTYTLLGIEHILLGIDHLLFVLALLLAVRGSWRLVKTVTAFTVAHSITLALASLGMVHVPGPPVEAAIALSIVFVASELVRGDADNPGLTRRRPWMIAFAFGLLHGFGFAGALSEIGLPQQDIPIALLMFNVGVELGQLSFVFVVLGLWRLARRSLIHCPVGLQKLPAYGIGIVAAYWTIDRVFGFLA